jgi:hypothetical protein
MLFSMGDVLKVLAWSLALVIALFAAMFLPGVGRVAESLLGPGYALPEAYWGSVHDPIQLGIAFVLNVAFYFVAIVIAVAIWRRIHVGRG